MNPDTSKLESANLNEAADLACMSLEVIDSKKLCACKMECDI